MKAKTTRDQSGTTYIFPNFSRLFVPKGASRKSFSPLFTFQCGEGPKFLSSSASRHQAAQVAVEFRKQKQIELESL